MPTLPLKGCDLATRLTPAFIVALKGRGYVAAGRYTKTLTADELDFCRKENFGLWFIHEGYGDLATMAQGQARGRADGIVAIAALRDLGINSGTVFSAVDFPAVDSQIKIISGYELGFNSSIASFLPGLYADGTILQSTESSTKCYLAGAKGWPGYEAFLASGRAAIVQKPTITLIGIQIDPCDIHDSSVVWWPNGIVPKTRPSKPEQQAAPPSPSHMPPLATLQQWLIADGQLPDSAADGIWGPRTVAALAKTYNP